VSPADRKLGQIVLGHILELAHSRCSISEDEILAIEDETLREILAGLMTLHEELQFREQERLAALRRNLELSTPILDVGHQVLLLPLIGTIDIGGSEQMVERTLLAVSDRRARVLVVDVTGVATIDAAVAARLLELFRAVALLGTHSILTGVSPANAQILVELDADLGRVQTHGTLGAGLTAAFALTNG
jgi:rsbT co-antagonist protein RsbR